MGLKKKSEVTFYFYVFGLTVVNKSLFWKISEENKLFGYLTYHKLQAIKSLKKVGFKKKSGVRIFESYFCKLIHGNLSCQNYRRVFQVTTVKIIKPNTRFFLKPYF